MGAKFTSTGGEQDVPISISSAGDNSVLAAISGRSLQMLSCALTAAGTVTITFGSDVGGSFVAKTGAFLLVANELFVLPLNDDGWYSTDSGKAANFKLSGAVAVTGVAKFQNVP